MRYVVNELWPVIFLHARDEPSTSTWLELLTSEPALIEATMAVSLRSWTSNSECRRRSDFHTSKAIRLIIDRVVTGQAHTDGFLFVAMTLAFREYLLQNHSASEVHLNAVSQAAAGRRNRGMEPLPPMLVDLLIQYVLPLFILTNLNVA